MPEQVIHFAKEYHTGHLREAASESLYQDLVTVDKCTDRVRGVNPALSPYKTPSLLRLAISPQVVPEKTREKRKQTGAWVTRLLVAAHVIRYPHIAHMKLGEYMDGVLIVNSVEEALGFLTLRRHHLEYFLSDSGQQQFDSLRLAGHAFQERYILDRALNDGIYLSRAENFN